MEDDSKEKNVFYEKNATCCSLELYWIDKNKEKDDNDSYDYQIYQIGKKNDYVNIYNGKNTNYQVENLEPNIVYIFILNIIKGGEIILKRDIKIKTLESPQAILSENSFKIANGEKIEYKYNLSDSQKNIIKNCSKLIFEGNNEDILIGNFDGIEIKLTYEIENHMYYISFDIKSKYFEKFFTQFIKDWEKNLITQCHFIIKKMPTILIFNLLEKGPVIFTGKRMGGVIASSLAFYILYIGISRNINYGNSFLKLEKNCIGVVTFGSPSFLTNLTAGYKMKELTPYFYNIKEEFDFIPEIIDFISKRQYNYNKLIDLFQKMEFKKEDEKRLKIYLDNNNFTDSNLKKTVRKFMKIPFGYYFMINASDNSFI